jgi:hypothetical protein
LSAALGSILLHAVWFWVGRVLAGQLRQVLALRLQGLAATLEQTSIYHRNTAAATSWALSAGGKCTHDLLVENKSTERRASNRNWWRRRRKLSAALGSILLHAVWFWVGRVLAGQLRLDLALRLLGLAATL